MKHHKLSEQTNYVHN